MAKEYAVSFYGSRAWEQCREGYMISRHYVCELCGAAALICHHIVPITPQTINDWNVTLNWDNLLAVCRECHSQLHGSRPTVEGLIFDGNGNLCKTPGVE